MVERMTFTAGKNISGNIADIVCIILFVALLVSGIVFGAPLAATLACGLILLAGHAVFLRGLAPVRVARACGRGLKAASLIIVLFVLIGALTAVWRASGTIAQIVTVASYAASPATIAALTFVACLVTTVFVGSSFAVSSTVGVTCVMAGTVMGNDIALLGGAMLSGCFLGERMSPVSGSIALTAQISWVSKESLLTKTFPLSVAVSVLCVALYAGMGFSAFGFVSMDPSAFAWLQEGFNFGWFCFLPAVAMAVCAAARLDARIVLLASLLTAGVVAVLFQGMGVDQLIVSACFGFQPDNEVLRQAFSGGGVVSMVNAMLVVSISSCYAGILGETKMLSFAERGLAVLARKTTPHFSCFLASAVASAIGCNQTLAIMLAHQLCQGIDCGKEELARSIADTALVIAPAVPWSIAGMVPLAAVGADAASIPLSFALFLVPAGGLVLSIVSKKGRSLRDRRSLPSRFCDGVCVSPFVKKLLTNERRRVLKFRSTIE